MKTLFLVSLKKMKKELSQSDGHHILIYGEINNQDLILNAKTYFSEKTIELNKKFSNGKTLKEFKKGLKTEGSAGSYGLVTGVTQDGSITKCLTLEEFSVEMSLKLNIEKQKNIKPSAQIYRNQGM